MEYHIGERVRFRPGAEVADEAMRVGGGTVEGYEEANDQDYVIVRVRNGGLPFDQWVLSEEIEPEDKANVRRGNW